MSDVDDFDGLRAVPGVKPSDELGEEDGPQELFTVTLSFSGRNDRVISDVVNVAYADHAVIVYSLTALGTIIENLYPLHAITGCECRPVEG